MKGSGFPWIGEIPAIWAVIKSKYILVSNDGGVWGADPRAESPNKVVLRSTEQTIDGKWSIENPAVRDLTGIAYEGCRISPGDLLVTKSSGSASHIGKTTLADDYFLEHECYYSNFLQRLRVSCYPKFAWYLFNTQMAREQFVYRQNSTSGIGNINSVDLENVYFPYPPLPEQHRIADFLDRKCAEIDAVIEKTKAAVEEYKKLKQSVITEAVTKGVRGPRPMKPSGVDWIGDVPEGWEADKVKHLFTNGKGLSITKENLVETGLPVISYGQIHSKNNSGTEITDDLLRYVDFQYQTDFPQCEVFQYDFVFADTSEDYDGCGNCAYKQDSSILFGGYHTIILHSNSKKDNKYFAYLFKTNSWRKQLREVATGVKLFTIAQKTLMNSSVIIPPESEQQEISDYLDRKCAGIDNILAKKQQFIKELEAYKKSLIYEYVTGKKEVKS